MTGVTLFSGGGLVECALSTRYGGPVEFIGAVEMDPAIAAHYRAAHGDHCLTASVLLVDFKRWRGAHYLHASPPCTNASVANALAGEAELDIDLARAIIRAIRHIRPKVFTLENVAGYKDFYAAAIIGWALDEMGYTWDWDIYNAANFGTPQTRKRLILRAVKGAKVLPDVFQTHAEAGKAAGQTGDLFADSKFLLPWNGWYAAIEDLLPQCPDSQLANWQKKRLPKDITETWLVGTQNSSYGVIRAGAFAPAPTLTSGTKEGGVRALLVMGTGSSGQSPLPAIAADSPSCTVRAGGHRPDSYRALLIGGGSAGEAVGTTASEQNPAFTTKATAKEPTRALIDGTRCVALTPRCLARFQGVPDSYPLPAKKSLAVKIIGNGVAVEMSRACFIPLMEGLL